jgi:hypothetical protein
MPKIAIFKNFLIFFYSSDLEERPHIHVIKNKTGFQNYAKFWISPSVELFKKGDFTDKELRTIEMVLQNNRNELLNQIERFRNGEHIKIIRLD